MRSRLWKPKKRDFDGKRMLEAFLLEPLLLTDDQVHEILSKVFRIPEVDELLKAMIRDAKDKQYGETR